MNQPANRWFRSSPRKPRLASAALYVAASISLLPTEALAASSSANYTILHDSLAAGGGPAASTAYQLDDSLGGFGGTIQSASGQIVISLGHLGQAQRLVPAITWNPPANIVYGTSLGANQLNADSQVSGTFAYQPPQATLLSAGQHALSAWFSPVDLLTYETVSVSVIITVNPAPLTITADNKTIFQGLPLPLLTASFSGFVNSDTPAVLDFPPTFTTVATPSSPAGDYAIIATGANDQNYTITHVNGTLTLLANSVPVPRNLSFQRLPGAAIRIPITKLLQAAHDSDGEVLSFISFDTVTALGAAVQEDAGWLIYQPVEGNNNPDSFSFTIADSRGAMATGILFISVWGDAQSPTQNLVTVVVQDDQVIVRFVGIPGVQYQIESAPALDNPAWQPLVVATAGLNGRFEARDTRAPGQMRFYRAVYVQGAGK